MRQSDRFCGWGDKATWVGIAAGILLSNLVACDNHRVKELAWPTRPDILGHEVESIAVVNGVVIDSGLFNRLYDRAMGAGRPDDVLVTTPIAARTKIAIAQRLVDSELLQQHAEAVGLSITENELARELRRFQAAFSSPDAYQQFIRNQPFGERSVRRIILDRLISRKLIDTEPVTDAEAKSYYDAHQTIFNVPAHLLVREIVVTTESASYRVATAIESGKLDFMQIARSFSEAATAKIGGSRGRTTANNIDEQVWAALQSMSDGDVVGPITTNNGIYFVQRLGSRDEKRQSYDSVSSDIKINLSMRRHAARLAALLQQLRASADVENRIERQYGRLITRTSIVPGQPVFGSEHTVPGPLPERESSGASQPN